LRDIFVAADHVRLADPVDAALGHRLARRDQAGTVGDTIFGIDPAGHVAVSAIGERQATCAQPEQVRDAAKSAVAPESAHPA